MPFRDFKRVPDPPEDPADRHALALARQQRTRDYAVAVEEVRMLQEMLQMCYMKAGVNHVEDCKHVAEAYMAKIQTRNYGAFDPSGKKNISRVRTPRAHRAQTAAQWARRVRALSASPPRRAAPRPTHPRRTTRRGTPSPSWCGTRTDSLDSGLRTALLGHPRRCTRRVIVPHADEASSRGAVGRAARVRLGQVAHRPVAMTLDYDECRIAPALTNDETVTGSSRRDQSRLSVSLSP